MDNFYITLPSNSSMDSYPSNTVSHYTTKLPQRLNLEGDWEVALVEIQIPQTWNNVDASNDNFQITYAGQRKRVMIPHGYYECLPDYTTVNTR